MIQKLYDKVTGYNDTASPSELKDTECRILLNMDLDESGGAITRSGFDKINNTIFGHEVEQEIEWLVNGVSRKLVVMNSKVFLMDNDGALTEKLAIDDAHIDTITIQNILYIMDGSEIYEWGKSNYDASETSIDIKVSEVIFNLPASSGGGVEGNFYKAKAAHGTTNLSTENFSNTTKWEDVTDIKGVISSVIRPVTPKNGGSKEKVKLVINYMANTAGDATITLNGVDKKVTLAADDTATAIAGKIRSASYTGWTTSGAGNEVYFEATTEGAKTGAFYDPGKTGAYGAVSIEQEGSSDDNSIDDVKKCTKFEQHEYSKRIFAVGNPDNPTAVYYSEFNRLDYWRSDSELYPTTPEAEAIALLPLDNVMLVGFNNSWWYWAGIEVGVDALWRRLPIPYGPISHKSVVLTPFSFTFTSATGVYTIQSSILSQEALMIQSDRMIVPLSKNKVDKTIKGIVKPYLAKAIYHDNKYMLAYCDDPLLTRNNKVLVFHDTTNGFTKWDGLQVNGWNKTSDNELRIATKNFVLQSKAGKISDINTDTGADKAIQSHIKTKDLDLGDPLGSKYVLFVYLLMKQFELMETQATLSIVADYKARLFTDVPLDESFIWGRSWGRVWGYRELMELEAELKEKASRFSIEIKDETLGNQIGFYGVGFSFLKLRPEATSIDDGRGLIK